MLDLQLSTIIFQIINFVILLAVLTRFLYQPVLRTMQRRQEAIAARLREADERAAQADAERERLSRVIQEAQVQAEEVVGRARAEAAAERTRLIEAARGEAARYRDEAQRAVQEQEREELARLQASIRQTAVGIAGSLIRQAAGPSVHQALVERLITGDIRADGALDPLRGRPGAAVVVELAYAPDPDQQDHLRLAFANGWDDVSFRVNPALLAGARILVGRQAVVDLSLQRRLADLLAEPVR
jgi:F-type H+-transporting ATPase subunit b